jgi:multicomponent Na+:H+ antiporter subunit F
MIAFDSAILEWAVYLSFALILAGLGFAFARLIYGGNSGGDGGPGVPDRSDILPDRIVALDLVTFLTVAFLGVFCIASGRMAFLDVAITLALVGFLATAAFARYVERTAAATTISAGRDD